MHLKIENEKLKTENVFLLKNKRFFRKEIEHSIDHYRHCLLGKLDQKSPKNDGNRSTDKNICHIVCYIHMKCISMGNKFIEKTANKNFSKIFFGQQTVVELIRMTRESWTHFHGRKNEIAFKRRPAGQSARFIQSANLRTHTMRLSC